MVILIVASLLPAAAQTCTDIPAAECQALNALYNATGGEQWADNSNWLTTGPAADRFGITVDGGHVTEIYLAFNNLTGTLPSDLVHNFLENLVNLKSLDLHFNNLTGPIPPELGNMTSLEWIYLNQNDFTGEIPPELANLPNLLRLNLYDNNLSGSIPPELGSMNSLYLLDLYANNLTGEIPPELGNLSNLVGLYLHKNHLSGSIPQQLGDLANLELLGLHYNSLTGTIPPELGNLSQLRVLELNSNNLSGDVPVFLATPPDTVNLSYNCLYATHSAVLAAMETKHNNNFMSTQTVAPKNVTAETIEFSGTEENRIRVSWDLISYVGNEGGYQVFYRQGTDIGYHYYGMTTDKNTSSMIVSNLEPGVEHTFLVDSFTWAHDNNQNDLQSRDSNTPSAVSGTLSRAFVPNWKQAPGYFTGVVVSNFGDTDFDVDFAAYDQDGVLDTLVQNPAPYNVGASKQLSKVGFEFFHENGPRNRLSWIELEADNSNTMGSIFLFGVSDTQMLDGAESQTTYAKKLYFTRPIDEWFIGGRNPDIQMCLVNPTDEEVTVKCVLQGANGAPEKTHTIPPLGFIAGNAEELVLPNHGIYNAYMEIEVTEGPGIVGFSRIEYPGIRTALGMNAVKASSVKKMYSAQLAHGANIVTNLRLVNTTDYRRSLTLTAIGDNGIPLADPVHAVIYARQIYNADMGTLFGLDNEGLIYTGSLVVESDGVGIIGDIIFAEGNTMQYAMSLPLQEKLFQEAVFNHISNLPTVFTGFAFYNPGEATATVQIEAFGTNGETVAEKTLVLGPGERIARTLNDQDIWPSFPVQSGGYIRIQSNQPIAGQQLFGDRSLRYMAAVPPTTRVEPMFD